MYLSPHHCRGGFEHRLVFVSERKPVAYQFRFQFVGRGGPHRPRLAGEHLRQAFAHVRAFGLRQRRVDQLPADALALQRRADLVCAPAAQPQLFAHEGFGIAAVVDETVADEFPEHLLGVPLGQPPAAHQPPGVALRFLGPGAEPHQRGERLFGGLVASFFHFSRQHIMRGLSKRSLWTAMSVYPSPSSMRTISSAACS